MNLPSLSEILDYDDIQIIGNLSPARIAALTDYLNLKLPLGYQGFLTQYGALFYQKEHATVMVAGLGVPPDSPLSLLRLHQEFWQHYVGKAPANFVPFAFVAPQVFHGFLGGDTPQNTAEQVYQFNGATQQITTIAHDLREYLYLRLRGEADQVQTGLKKLLVHTESFENEYLKPNKIPRNHVYRPARFCTRDVILGLTVVRLSVEDNFLEVDICLTAEPPDLAALSGARTTLTYLLTEAYKCGGSMGIRFTKNVENDFRDEQHGRIPTAFVRLAANFQIDLQHVLEGIITPHEAEELYLALTDFPPAILTKIKQLSQAGYLAPARACYMIHHGVWSFRELEMLLNSDLVEDLLLGERTPLNWAFYNQNLQQAEGAVLGGLLENLLYSQERYTETGEVEELEDDERDVQIDFVPEYYGFALQGCSTEIPLKWGVEDKILLLPSQQKAFIAIRAKQKTEIENSFANDLAACQHFQQQQAEPLAWRLLLLYPADFNELKMADQQQIVAQAQSQGIELLVNPQTCEQLKGLAEQRFAASKVCRE